MDDSDSGSEESQNNNNNNKEAIKRLSSTSLTSFNGGGNYSGAIGIKAKKMKFTEVKQEPDFAEGFGEESMDRPIINQPRVSPSQMVTIVENLSQYITEKSKGNRRFITFSDYDAIPLPDGVTSDMVRMDIRRYVREAVTLSTLNLKTAVDILTTFLSGGSSLTMDPEFPKKPPTAFNIFMRNSLAPGVDMKEAMVNRACHWKSGSYPEERSNAEKEALELHRDYFQQLVAYKERHPELNGSHAAFLNKLIESTRKSLKKTDPTMAKDVKNKKGPGKKASQKNHSKTKATKTPFELFCMSKSDKYADMEPEKRDRKLRKKFEKLTEAEREIYDNLSAAL